VHDLRWLAMTKSLTRREIVGRLAGVQKSNRGAGAYARLVNRPLGRQFAALAVLAGLSPTQVSAISAAFSYAGIAVIAAVRPNVAIAILVAALLVLGYALDSADGQVARVTGRGSVAGEWIDHMIDAAKITALHCAIAVCWFRFYDISHGFLLIPLGYAVVASVFFFGIVLADLLRRIVRVNAGGTAVTTSSVNPNEPAPWLRSLLVLPNDYGILCVVMVLLAAQRVFTVVYTVLFVANALLLLAGSARWYRELRRL
jgi:phosphatidylglycerophosphate synthase